MSCVSLGLLVVAATLFAHQLHSANGDACLKIGFNRTIAIPDCVEFPVTTNACRGQCHSFAVPAIHSGWEVPDIQSSNGSYLVAAMRWSNMLSTDDRRQSIVSVGQCCNYIDWEEIAVIVDCIGGRRKVIFRSAVSCACDHCSKV